MPQKQFDIWLDGTTRIAVLRETRGGVVHGFAVVLMTLIDGKWVDVDRFDTAHGRPHRDVLGRKGGLLRKIWSDTPSHRQAFEAAIAFYRREHEAIRQRFLLH